MHYFGTGKMKVSLFPIGYMYINGYIDKSGDPELDKRLNETIGET